MFGFEVVRKNKKDNDDLLPSIVPPSNDDGSIEVAPGGAYGTYVDLEGKSKTEGELVNRYRDMSIQAECDAAIQDVVNEAIVVGVDEGPIKIVLDKLEYPEAIKDKIREEFEKILEIMDFNNNCYDIFKKWYIDGRLYYHIVIDEKNTSAGIKDLRYIDPRKIRKIKEPIKRRDPKTGATVYVGVNEYYMYNATGLSTQNTTHGLKIAKDSICYVHSGVFDLKNNLIYSHLHKAIKPLNQLRMLEDAVVIYRLARAPERRIFYIDVGNLPKAKAEQYMRDMMVKHKNKLTYDATTGEIRDDRKFMTMLEDFWLPRREGGRGTEITTLPSGANLGEMDDVDYFRRKMYKSLNVPVTRMESENQFNIGRGTEITRDEIKFSKFIKRLRARFSVLFDNLLETQLILKGVLSKKDWKEIKQKVYYDFIEDNHFSELKDTEMLRERLQLAGEADGFVGKYFSEEYIMLKILRFTEDEVKNMKKQMDKEKDENKDEFEDDQAEDVPPKKQEQPAPKLAVKEEMFILEQASIDEDQQELIDRMTAVMAEVADEEHGVPVV